MSQSKDAAINAGILPQTDVRRQGQVGCKDEVKSQQVDAFVRDGIHAGNFLNSTGDFLVQIDIHSFQAGKDIPYQYFL